jgi:nucleoside-diphosphate-sugar epimerase
MKVLLVGGTGTISTGVEKVVIEERGYELYVLNRGSQRSLDRMHPEAHLLKADYNDEESVKAALGDLHFDTVVDFRIQGVADQEKAVRIFDGRTDQYILISSGTVYRKPLEKYLVTEDMPLGNIHSAYARNKVASEMTLRKYIEKGFPGVIVRPSLTYADFNPLVAINSRKDPYSIIWRMRKGKPIIVHGDGTNLWTITHNTDFGRGILGICGNPKAIGEAFHITSDEVLDWNAIYTELAHAAGVDANLVHIASDFIGDFEPGLRESLEGDHAVSMVFDNTKIKTFNPDFKYQVPWAEGAKRIVSWFDADPAVRETADEEWDQKMDALIEMYQGRNPKNFQ